MFNRPDLTLNTKQKTKILSSNVDEEMKNSRL